MRLNQLFSVWLMVNSLWVWMFGFRALWPLNVYIFYGIIGMYAVVLVLCSLSLMLRF